MTEEHRLPDLATYFQQNEFAIAQLGTHLSKLRGAIDSSDVESIAFHLDMLKASYHLLEGNNMNIRNVVLLDHPEIAKYVNNML